MTNLKPVRLRSVVSELHEASVLLFRGQGVISRLIRFAGRSEYSHAALITYNGSRSATHTPYCTEIREWKGGRTNLLQHQVELNDGRIDVYRPTDATLNHPEWSCLSKYISRRAKEIAKPDRYGWGAFRYCMRAHIPIWRRLFKPNYEEDTDIYPHCSALVSMAWRSQGLDLVPNLPDYKTEPGDLARSALLQYQFTLVSE